MKREILLPRRQAKQDASPDDCSGHSSPREEGQQQIRAKEASGGPSEIKSSLMVPVEIRWQQGGSKFT
ncbi:BEM_HP_G0079990.mRNA.1.CDS.1 [Saccharomyces cerevisiae]|nr:BEM_HP_G0079990.mRNA.1.CDS.1 [Saccharomyces cerevisiae]CAI6991812.1 BEM_HP_G0079990.mRNA.1.CDS.1 [Saccharomyces cerevisiae]